MRNRWKVGVARDGWEPSDSTILCAAHFTADCYEDIDDCRSSVGLQPKTARLRHGAVPTLFVGLPPNGNNEIVDEPLGAQYNTAVTDSIGLMTTMEASSTDMADAEPCTTSWPVRISPSVASKSIQVEMRLKSRNVRCQTTPKVARTAVHTPRSVANLVSTSSQTEVASSPHYWQSSPIRSPDRSPQRYLQNFNDEMEESVTNDEADLSLLYEEVLAEKYKQDPRIVVTLDIRKAFDSVPQWAVVREAKACGIHGRTLYTGLPARQEFPVEDRRHHGTQRRRLKEECRRGQFYRRPFALW
ncbi:uncharacterized protein ISCGN_010797 [Ixodes scapularis]